jgi:hypothetical protein
MFRRLLYLTAAAAVALAACTSAPAAAPALTDPKDILTKSALTLKDLKTAHLHADVTGTVKLDITNSGNAVPLDLKGTNGDGDLDVTNKKVHIGFSAPALLGVAADVIVIGNDTYTKVNLLGPKYTKSTSTDTTNPASAAQDPQKAIDQINQFLNQPGVAPTKNADVKCGDKDCYDVSMTLTSDQLKGVTGSLASSAPTGNGTVDVWVQKDTLRPTKVTITADAGDAGTITVALTISNYDAPVTINAPADADVAAPSPTAS